MSALRALIAAASPTPWEWHENESGYPAELLSLGVGVIRPALDVSPTSGTVSAYLTNDAGSAEASHPDFALIVTLANAANEVEALVEAVEPMIAASIAAEGDFVVPPPSLVKARDALRAAHAALVAKLEGKA